MGKSHPRKKSSFEVFLLCAMTFVSLTLGILLLSNQEGVKSLTNEVARTEEDLIDLVVQIRSLSGDEIDPAEQDMETEKLARERLHWTAPGEFIIRIEDE